VEDPCTGRKGTNGTNGTYGTYGAHGAHGANGTNGTNGTNRTKERERQVGGPGFLRAPLYQAEIMAGLRDSQSIELAFKGSNACPPPLARRGPPVDPDPMPVVSGGWPGRLAAVASCWCQGYPPRWGQYALT
jgi:hypothetical protein